MGPELIRSIGSPWALAYLTVVAVNVMILVVIGVMREPLCLHGASRAQRAWARITAIGWAIANAFVFLNPRF